MFQIYCQRALYSTLKIRQNIKGNKYKSFVVSLGAKPEITEVNEKKQQSSDNIKDHLIQIFLPRGYPHTVTPNYLKFCLWNVVSSISGSVSSRMGQASSIGVAATLNWVIKDGLGLLGGVLYTALLSGKFDSEPKKYRWYSSIFLLSATFCELLTPLAPQYFLLLASTANIAKNIAWLTLSGTRAQMHQSLCLRDNLADITSKSGSQMTAAGLIGTSAGIGASALLGGSVVNAILLFIPLSAISLFGVYKSNLCVPTASINVQRGELILKHAFETGKILSPSEVSDKERFVLGYKSVFKKNLFMNSLITVIKSEDLEKYLERLKQDKFLVYEDSKKDFHLWFTKDATSEEMIKGFFDANLKRYKTENVDSEVTLKAQEFVDLISKNGWKTEENSLNYTNKLSIE